MDGRLTAMKALDEEREQLRTALAQHKAALDAAEAEAAQLKARVAELEARTDHTEHVRRLEAQLAQVQQAYEAQQQAGGQQLKVAERAHADEMAGLQGEVERVRHMMEQHRAEAQRLKDHVCRSDVHHRCTVARFR